MNQLHVAIFQILDSRLCAIVTPIIDNYYFIVHTEALKHFFHVAYTVGDDSSFVVRGHYDGNLPLHKAVNNFHPSSLFRRYKQLEANVPPAPRLHFGTLMTQKPWARFQAPYPI